MKRFFLRIQTYLKELAGITTGAELPFPQSDIEESLYTICQNNPDGIISDRYGFKKVTGSVTPNADQTYLDIDENYENLQAIYIVTDLDQAKAKGANTVYGAKGVVATGETFASMADTLYYPLNASLSLGGAATSTDNNNGKIRISVSATRFFRNGLTYKYACYYWNDNI